MCIQIFINLNANNSISESIFNFLVCKIVGFLDLSRGALVEFIPPQRNGSPEVPEV
jgi:hypothetical protein